MRVLVPEGSEFAAKRGADPVAEILKKCKTIAVVGLSSNPLRPSHEVSEYMQRAGYRIIPVNPENREVLGEKSYARLEDIPEKVDIVDVFRRPEFVPEIVESAIRIGAKAVWMQEGVIHAEAAEKARRTRLKSSRQVRLLHREKISTDFHRRLAAISSRKRASSAIN